MSSSDLVTLAQMDGKMQWLAGYGNLTSEKTYRLPTKAAIVYMIALPVWLGTRNMEDMEILNIGSGVFHAVISFDNDFVLPVCVSIIQKKSIGKITG